MRTHIPEKLLNIASDIEEKGPQNVTRMTVLKRWFSDPVRLSSFAIFIAKTVSGRKGKSKGDEAALFKSARGLLKDARICDPQVPEEQTEMLLNQLSAYQNDYAMQKWASVRILRNHNLYLIEQGLRIYLRKREYQYPFSGYRLAVNYCQNYDAAYGTMLDEHSLFKIHEIVRFMFNYEALIEFL